MSERNQNFQNKKEKVQRFSENETRNQTTSCSWNMDLLFPNYDDSEIMNNFKNYFSFERCTAKIKH